MAKKQNQENEVIAEGMLNQIVYIETVRQNGTLRIQQDFQYCPTLAEQHTAHLSDINYLMEKYQPDELAAYIAARGAHRTEILGHDFSEEPSLQDAKNVIYNIRKAFDELPDEIKYQFRNHVEFMKFIDNPANQEKMIKMGLLKRQEIEKLTGIPNSETAGTESRTTTKSASDAKEAKAT